MNKLFFLLLFFLLSVSAIKAQDSIALDEIIVIVGDQIVMKSDLLNQLKDYQFPDELSKQVGTCEVLQGSVFQQLFLQQAIIDSIKVTDDEVNGEVNRRLEYFITQFGSKDLLEQFYGKTVAEIKDEMREPLRELKLAQKMKSQVVGTVQVSPSDVKDFFNSIPADSLPFFNTQYEVAQIVIYAKPTSEEDLKAKTKIEDIRKRILKGDKFETMAVLYSEDDASAIKGGDLGMRSRLEFVPEFGAAAMKLKKDSISDVIKTQYGYHILKMVDRKGEKVHVKHILIKPKVTLESKQIVQEKLKDISKLIRKDSLTFETAAFKYSEDEATKNNGGLVIDAQTGSSKVDAKQFETSLFFVVDTMNVGDIVGPVSLYAADGRIGYRIVYLKSKIAPHKANLNQDYPEIKSLAEVQKQQEVMLQWIEKKMKETYLVIYPPYDQCENLKIYKAISKQAN